MGLSFNVRLSSKSSSWGCLIHEIDRKLWRWLKIENKNFVEEIASYVLVSNFIRSWHFFSWIYFLSAESMSDRYGRYGNTGIKVTMRDLSARNQRWKTPHSSVSHPLYVLLNITLYYYHPFFFYTQIKDVMQYWFPSVTVKYCTFLFVILPINMCKCNCSVNYQRLNTFTKVNAISFMQWKWLSIWQQPRQRKKRRRKRGERRGRYLVIHSRFLLGKSALTDILSSNTCRLLIESRSGSPPPPSKWGP